MSWFYNDIEVTDENIPHDAVGFVYKITHTPSGMYYIGKKMLKYTKNVAIGKKELQKIVEQRKAEKKSGKLPQKKQVVSESDWKTYYSSSDVIKSMVSEGLAHEFKREILRYCKSKKSLSYYEVKYQFDYNVLGDELSFNSNILGKFFNRDLELD